MSYLKSKTTRGMTLLEVLVTMLLIAVAMVGSISMLQVSIKYNQNANYYSMALYSAQQIIGKIRANSQEVSLYQQKPDTLNNVTDCFADTCSNPGEVAKSDLKQWSDEIKLLLPDGKGEVKSLGKNVYEVAISWSSEDIPDGIKESGSGSSSAPSVNTLEKKLELPFSL